MLTTVLHECSSSNLDESSIQLLVHVRGDRCRHGRRLRKSYRSYRKERYKSFSTQFTKQRDRNSKMPLLQESPEKKSPSVHRCNSQSGFGESLAIIQRVNSYFETALDFRSSCFVELSQNFDDDAPSELAKRLEFQLKFHMFDRSDAIPFLRLFHSFQMECDTDDKQEPAEVCLFFST